MMIYLDYAATTPMSAEALQTYTKAASQYFGNEQSLRYWRNGLFFTTSL